MRASLPFDYDEVGAGPLILFVPGSCSTGAAWRPTLSRLPRRFRTVTTALPGYGGTMERRSAADASIAPVASAIEDVIARIAAPVHLVGHSFGGLAGLAVALRGRAPLLSLTIFEAPAPGILAARGEHAPLAAFRRMTDVYVDRHRAGAPAAIADMIDFYGGPGTFASWPANVQAYAVKTTETNILDWQGAYDFAPAPETLARLRLPVAVAVGANSHPAVVRANFLISEEIPGAAFVTIAGASHFMTATHPEEVARLVAAVADRAGALS
jgi:pimeloyl-ACP methyl ester carboxylesterase